MEFYSGQPENPAASVRDYCTGVLKPKPDFIARKTLSTISNCSE
jgi:hypothetical protein